MSIKFLPYSVKYLHRELWVYIILLIIAWLYFLYQNRIGLLEIETLLLSIHYRYGTWELFSKGIWDYLTPRMAPGVSSWSPSWQSGFQRQQMLLTAITLSSSHAAGWRAGCDAWAGYRPLAVVNMWCCVCSVLHRKHWECATSTPYREEFSVLLRH